MTLRAYTWVLLEPIPPELVTREVPRHVIDAARLAAALAAPRPWAW